MKILTIISLINLLISPFSTVAPIPLGDGDVPVPMWLQPVPVTFTDFQLDYINSIFTTKDELDSRLWNYYTRATGTFGKVGGVCPTIGTFDRANMVFTLSAVEQVAVNPSDLQFNNWGALVYDSNSTNTNFIPLNFFNGYTSICDNPNITNRDSINVCVFSEVPNTYYTVSLSVSPYGSGSVSGSGSFIEGSAVTVTATSNSGFLFVNWTENGKEVSTSKSYTFNITSDRNLVANFVVGSTSSLYVIGKKTYNIIDVTFDDTRRGSCTVIGANNSYTTCSYSSTINVVYETITSFYPSLFYVGVGSNNSMIYQTRDTTTTSRTNNCYNITVQNGQPYSCALPTMPTIPTDTFTSCSPSPSCSIYGTTFYADTGGQLVVNPEWSEKLESIDDVLHNADTSDNDKSNGLLSDNVDNVNNLQDSLFNDFSDNINNLDTDTSSFISSISTSANWVRARFDDLTLNNPFGTYLQYTLLIGFAILIIGRRLN